jgi:hypothetical protein
MMMVQSAAQHLTKQIAGKIKQWWYTDIEDTDQ